MYKSGDILLVKFHPGYGSEIKKYRPALVISDATEKVDPRFVLITPILTQVSKKKHALEIELVRCSFLKKKSYALLWYPLTIDTQRVQYTLGHIPSSIMRSVQKRLRLLFAPAQ